MIRIGAIGYGYWGPKLVRTLEQTSGASVTAICDLKPERLAEARKQQPSANLTTDDDEVLADGRIDAVAIATPAGTHFDLASRALKAGKHVLIEKPMAVDAGQALQLLEEETRAGRVLMVDHTFVYTGAVRRIRELLADGEIGDVYYFDSVRINLGRVQPDVNVIFDLAVHDLSIMDYLFEQRPCAISATGFGNESSGHEKIAHLTLFFKNSMMAHIHVSWLAPVKVRRTLICGNGRMIVYDDLEPTQKVKVFKNGIAADQRAEEECRLQNGADSRDPWAPELDGTEALRKVAGHFIDCIAQGKKPLTGGLEGLRTVRIMEAATRSMVEKGRLIELDLT